MSRAKSLIEEYLSGFEWAVRDNANVPQTVSGLMSHLLGSALYEEALKSVPQPAIKVHEEGWIYIYKLRDGSVAKPYCGGIDSRPIIEKGLVTPTIVSRPPRHMDSAVDQLMNAVYIFSQERTGAVGLYGVDLNLAPFVRSDKLDYRAVKQNIQRFIYNLNYPLKAGQSPFSNIVFAISNRFYRAMPIPVPKNSKFRLGASDTYESYIDEARAVIKAIVEVFAEGDALHQPFTFPIPATIFNQEFAKILDEDPELREAYWSMVASVGQMYFLNGFNNDNAENLFSFCCRLLSDMRRVREVLHQAKGVWDMPPSVGSVNLVVINLPRLAAIARVSDDRKMLDMLDHLLELARHTLMWFRARYERLFKMGMYPMTREYIDPVNPFKYYYNTVGVIGLAEYVSIMVGDPYFWFHAQPSDIPKVVKLYEDILSHINKRLAEFEEQDEVLYNLEEVPGETLGVKLAWKDWDFFKEISVDEDLRVYIPVGEVDGRKAPFYTNQLTPQYTSMHLKWQLEIESRCQKLFTGGVMKHVFVDQPLPPEIIEKFVNSVMRSTDVVYMSVTPTVAVCPSCGYRAVGRYVKCPKCGNPMDLWSRIVGYYRPVRNWNSGRVAEFNVRRDLSKDILDLINF